MNVDDYRDLFAEIVCSHKNADDWSGRVLEDWKAAMAERGHSLIQGLVLGDKFLNDCSLFAVMGSSRRLRATDS